MRSFKDSGADGSMSNLMLEVGDNFRGVSISLATILNFRFFTAEAKRSGDVSPSFDNVRSLLCTVTSP